MLSYYKLLLILGLIPICNVNFGDVNFFLLSGVALTRNGILETEWSDFSD